MPEIVSQDEARAKGLKLFFTGKPCRHGHVCQRYTSTNQCWECLSLRNKKRYEENPADFKLRSKTWRSTNLEAAKKSDRERRYKKVYGLSILDLDLLKIQQNNTCCCCPKSIAEKFHTDHCHTTGVVRGLLCSSCNTALGLVKDSTQILTNMISYLEKFNPQHENPSLESIQDTFASA